MIQKTTCNPVGQFFKNPFHSLQLQRLPVRERETLQPWDAADSYLLQYLEESPPEGRILICNDNFGALSLALSEFKPTLYSDSWLAHQSTRHNANLNNMDPERLHYLPATKKPEGKYDLVLLKIPKKSQLVGRAAVENTPMLS